MNVGASTSSELGNLTSSFRIKKPRSRDENRLLKVGFVDDNNEHLSYFTFSIIWPAAACAVFSVLLFLAATLGSLYTDYVPTEMELKRSFFGRYGTSYYQCNSTLPLPKNAVPSILNLFEINVIGNVMFRLCVCIPMVIRVFISNCHSMILRSEYELVPFFYRVSVEVLPLLTFLEVLALSLFSIVTVHFDFAELNRFCKIVFVMTAGMNMVITSAVQYSYSKSSKETGPLVSWHKDQCSLRILLPGATVLPTQPLCHFFSHLLLARAPRVRRHGVHDDRRLRRFPPDVADRHPPHHVPLLPADVLGECEPLDPQNFARGAKFEHCRAFEYQQRRVLNL